MHVLLALAAVATLALVVGAMVLVALAVRAVQRLTARVSAAGRRLGPAGHAARLARREERVVMLLGTATRIADSGERSALRARFRLRQAVTAAGGAVAAAERTGAPVGELPYLLVRLRAQAGQLESRLAVTAGSPAERDAACGEAAEVAELARQVQRAAADALAATTGASAGDLADDVLAAVSGVHAAAAWLRERGGDLRARRRMGA
jgi:hypothetical protein